MTTTYLYPVAAVYDPYYWTPAGLGDLLRTVGSADGALAVGRGTGIEFRFDASSITCTAGNIVSVKGEARYGLDPNSGVGPTFSHEIYARMNIVTLGGGYIGGDEFFALGDGPPMHVWTSAPVPTIGLPALTWTPALITANVFMDAGESGPVAVDYMRLVVEHNCTAPPPAPAGAAVDWLGRPACGPGSGLYQTCTANQAGSVLVGAAGPGTVGIGVGVSGTTSSGTINWCPSVWNSAVLNVKTFIGGNPINVSGYVHYRDLTNSVVVMDIPNITVSTATIHTLPNLPASAIAVTSYTLAFTAFTPTASDHAMFIQLDYPGGSGSLGPNNGADIPCGMELSASTKTLATPANVRVGDPVSWIITARNTAASSGTVHVTDTLPAGFTWTAPGFIPSSGVGNVDATATIPPQGALPITVTGTAAAIGTLGNTAMLNGVAFVGPSVAVVGGVVDVVNEMSAVDTEVSPGGVARTIWTIHNLGPDGPVTLPITCNLPVGAVSRSILVVTSGGATTGLTNSSTGTLVSSVTLPANAYVKISIFDTIATLSQLPANYVYTNIGSIGDIPVGYTESQPGNNVASSAYIPLTLAVIATKVATPTQLVTGDALKYTIKIVNNDVLPVDIPAGITDAFPIELVSPLWTVLNTGGATGLPVGPQTSNPMILPAFTLPGNGAFLEISVTGTVNGYPNTQIGNSLTGLPAFIRSPGQVVVSILPAPQVASHTITNNFSTCGLRSVLLSMSRYAEMCAAVDSSAYVGHTVTLNVDGVVTVYPDVMNGFVSTGPDAVDAVCIGDMLSWTKGVSFQNQLDITIELKTDFSGPGGSSIDLGPLDLTYVG